MIRKAFIPALQGAIFAGHNLRKFKRILGSLGTIFTVIIFLIVSPSEVFAQAATLSLDPSTGAFNRGCSFSLAVNLDTGGAQTDGTDAILIYDTSRFTAVSITNGTIYPDYPGNNIDSQAGKITMAGLASVSTAFAGKGVLATVNFKVNDTAATGATQITFDFDPNNKSKTTDSNVVQRDPIVDVLNSVVNGSYTIGTGVCGAQATPTPTPLATFIPGTGGPVSTPSATLAPTPIPTKQPYLPPAGSADLTFTVAITGGILTILGILGLALL